MHTAVKKEKTWFWFEPTEHEMRLIKTFLHPLTLNFMTVTEIQMLLRSMGQEESHGEVKQEQKSSSVKPVGRNFSLSWRRLTKLDGGGMFYDRDMSEKVLGILEITVPTVLIRGEVECAEVLQICTNEILRGTMAS